MKSRSGYNLILNTLVIFGLVALIVQWIWLEKKPNDLDSLLQNEASYCWQINENTLNDFKNKIESIQPQHRKIGRIYYAHFVTVSKALDSSRTLIQKAISSGRNRDSLSRQAESVGKLFDSIFDQYLLLREKFSPDSIKDESPYRKEQILEYNKDTEEGKAWISDFKNEIKKQDWSKTHVELQPLMLYELEWQYIDFMTSNYSMLTGKYFDQYVYMAQGPVIAGPKLKRGSLAFNPPREMELFKKERIKVLINKRFQQALLSKSKDSNQVIDSVSVSEIMTVKVLGEDFEIVPLDEEEQGVTDDGYTQWEFDVTPKKSGSLDLYVKAGIVYSLPQLGVARKSFPVYERKIDVHVNPVERLAYFVTDRWEFIISTFLIPALSWGYSRMRRRRVKTS